MTTIPSSAPLSRRKFLRSTALAALSAPVLSSAADDLDVSKDCIDAHVHVWTPDQRKYPTADGMDRKGISPVSFTPDELFAHSRPNGVSRTVLVQMSFYKFDNSCMLDAMKQHPGVFSGVGIVDDTKPDVIDTMTKLSKQGVRGLRLYADKKNVEGWQDAAGMKAMWAHAEHTGMAMCLLANPDALPAIQRMCAMFPRTRVVIDHFARIGMKDGVKPADLEALCRLAEFPNTHVKTSAFYALGAKKAPYTDLAPMIQKLRDTFGASRLMWATDCPFQVEDGHTYKDSIALIREKLGFLTPEDKAWMLRKTAEKVFFQ